MTNQVKNCFKVYVKDNKGLKKTQLLQILGMRMCVYIYMNLMCLMTLRVLINALVPADE